LHCALEKERIVEKPKTIQGVLDALWYAVVGLNGEGLIDTVRGLREDMVVLKAQAPTLWTRSDHDQEHKEDEAKAKQSERIYIEMKKGKGVTLREWVTIFVALGAVIVAIFALVLKN
jgi:hypothetical protein